MIEKRAYHVGELVELFGTKSQKEGYRKSGCLQGNSKKTLLDKVSRVCSFEYSGRGMYELEY